MQEESPSATIEATVAEEWMAWARRVLETSATPARKPGAGGPGVMGEVHIEVATGVTWQISVVDTPGEAPAVRHALKGPGGERDITAEIGRELAFDTAYEAAGFRVILRSDAPRLEAARTAAPEAGRDEGPDAFPTVPFLEPRLR